MKGQFKTLDIIEKNANSSKEQWKVLKNEISMLKQSKIALEKDGTIQFQLASKKKNANTFKDFNLAGNLVRKLPVTPNKFNKNLMKQYYKNIEKN